MASPERAPATRICGASLSMATIAAVRPISIGARREPAMANESGRSSAAVMAGSSIDGKRERFGLVSREAVADAADGPEHAALAAEKRIAHGDEPDVGRGGGRGG